MTSIDPFANPDAVLCPVPVEVKASEGVSLAPRVAGFDGIRVGFLGNLKPNCDVLLHTTEEEVMKSGASGTLYREKDSCSVGAPEAMLDEIAASCQAAVVALGD